MSSLEIVLYLVVFIICVILSGFFSSSETAFISLQRFKLEHMVHTEVKGASRVARMLKQPARLLSVILLGNNFVQTLAASTATVIAISFLGEKQGILIATVVVTIILLVFGETTPKTIATQHAERLSLLFARPIEIISWLFTPFVVALSWIASAVTRLVGGEPVSRSLISGEEIRTMISVGHREGTVEEAEAKLLDNVFEFGDRPVSEVMVRRPKVVWVEQGTKLGDFLTLYTGAPLSRFPVYQENRDNVVGTISVKDVLMALAKGALGKDSPIDGLIRPAYFAPESKHVSEVFAEMRDNNYHMAVIIDEFGGTTGVVSLSRLIEEIVGPVGDELAGMAKDYEIINEHTFQIDGSMRIEETNAKMGLDLPEGNYKTVAGFVLHLLGNIPKQGEQLRYRDLKLIITKMHGRKIEEVLLTRELQATGTGGSPKSEANTKD